MVTRAWEHQDKTKRTQLEEDQGEHTAIQAEELQDAMFIQVEELRDEMVTQAAELRDEVVTQAAELRDKKEVIRADKIMDIQVREFYL